MASKSRVYKQVVQLFWSIFAALITFGVIAFILAPKGENVIAWPAHYIENLKTTIIILALGGIPAGMVFHQHLIKKIPPGLPPEKKLVKFRNSFLIKIVLYEALATIALIGYLVSTDFSFALIYLVMLIAYTLNKPGWATIEKELDL